MNKKPTKNKTVETTADILKRIRVDWGEGNYAPKVFKDKTKYTRKEKHKKNYCYDE